MNLPGADPGSALQAGRSAALCCYLLLRFNFIVSTQIALPQTLHLLTPLKQLAEGTAVLYTTVLENDDLVGTA